MVSAAEKKQIEELLEQCRAMAAQQKERSYDFAPRNEDLLQEICTSLTVPTSAFGMSYARAYYGETTSIWGIPIDAGLGLILHGLAACFGFTADKGMQRVGKFVHDIANGAFASWAAALGAEFGLKKRMEEPAPAPQPNTGADEMPKFGPGPMTHEDLAVIKARMAANTKQVMVERTTTPPPVHAPPPAPPPMPPIRNTEVAVAKTPAPAPQSETPQHSPLNVSPPIVATAASPAAPQKQYRFTKRWAVDPEAEMSRLLQSHGAPSDPQTVASVLYGENPMETYRAIVRKARAPA